MEGYKELTSDMIKIDKETDLRFDPQYPYSVFVLGASLQHTVPAGSMIFGDELYLLAPRYIVLVEDTLTETMAQHIKNKFIFFAEEREITHRASFGFRTRREAFECLCTFYHKHKDDLFNTFHPVAMLDSGCKCPQEGCNEYIPRKPN